MPTQLARTASVEQLLRCLAALAQSPAYQAELENTVSYMSQNPLPGSFRDLNGQSFSLDLADNQYGPPQGWVGKSRADSLPGFAKVWITDQLRVPGGPYPLLELIAMPGRRGPANMEVYKEWLYVIDAVAITAGPDPNAIQRDALAMIDAFEQLVYRNNPALGGLVVKIDAPAGPVPSGSQADKSGAVAAAMVRFECLVLRTRSLP
jgi:hypothetical protein